MQENVISNDRSITADNHSLRKVGFIGHSRSTARLSAVFVPGNSPEGLPHMQKSIKSDSKSITADNHSLVDTEFTSHAKMKTHSLTEELLGQRGIEQ